MELLLLLQWKHFIKYLISLDLLVWDEPHLETNSQLIKIKKDVTSDETSH